MFFCSDFPGHQFHFNSILRKVQNLSKRIPLLGNKFLIIYGIIMMCTERVQDMNTTAENLFSLNFFLSLSETFLVPLTQLGLVRCWLETSYLFPGPPVEEHIAHQPGLAAEVNQVRANAATSNPRASRHQAEALL